MVLMALIWALLAATPCHEAAPPLLSFEFALPGSHRSLHLHAWPVFVNGAVVDFLDHRVGKGVNILLVRNQADRHLYYSTDMAKTWIRIPTDARPAFERGFITDEWNVLVWGRGQIRLLDMRGSVLATCAGGQYPWHGNWSIGQAGSTIMWAEYASGKELEEKGLKLKVFRSQDGGRTWAVVFQQPAGRAGDAQIDHFHMVQPDPYRPHHWYLSSGDTSPHSRVWLSKDDGETWVEVTDPHPAGKYPQSIHRFTSVIFAKDYLCWATDDLVGTGKARVVKAKRGEPLKVEVVGTLGDECVRNAVITDYGTVFISEAKNRRSAGANIYLFAHEGQVVYIGAVSREANVNLVSGATYSRGSKVAVNGEFFTYACFFLFRAHTATLLWRMD